MNVNNFKEALALATVIRLGDKFFDVDLFDKSLAVDECEDTCLIIADRDTGDEISFTYDELIELDADCDIRILTITEVKW